MLKGRKMKAVVIKGPGQVELTEKPLPVPPPGWARIKVKAACVCATDLEVVDGKIPCNYPLTPGHEWSGVVDAVGLEQDGNWVSKRVVGSNDICCLVCEECRSGNWRNCASFREIGFRADGAYAEYMLVPVYALYELPEEISYIQGAMIEPLGVGLGTIDKAGLKLGETVTVIGTGSIGLNIIAVARAAGAGRIIAAASSSRRLEFAKLAGAARTVATSEEDLETVVKQLHQGGSDVICEATGAMECLEVSMKIAKKSGRILLAGYSGQKTINFMPNLIHVPNLKLIGAGNNWNMVSRCIRLLQYGLVDNSKFATHFFCLQDYKEALDMTRTRPEGFLKSVFLFDDTAN